MKKNTIGYIISITIIAVIPLITSCERRPLEDALFTTAKIPVKIYWDLAGISPKNATVMFYREDGSFYKEWQTESDRECAEGYAELEPGRYTAVAFNELRNQIEYVRIRGWERLETLEAYISENTKPAYMFSSRDENEVQVQRPGILAACKASINITPDMISQTHYTPVGNDYFALTNLHPDRKTAQANMIVHVRGINNARMPAMAELRHMASGYFFATDKNSLSPVTAQFTMNNRKYLTDSKKDGNISATITTFGVLGEWHHTADTPDASFFLDLAFMLVDEKQTVVEFSADITDIMEIAVDEKIAVSINIETGLGELPEVKPVGSDSGFSTELIDWDKVIVPLYTGK